MRAYIGACTGAEWGAEGLVTFMVSGLMMADLRSAPIMILSCHHREAVCHDEKWEEDETENTLLRRTTSHQSSQQRQAAGNRPRNPP